MSMKMEEDDEDDSGQREEGKISTLIGGTALGANENEEPRKVGKSARVTLMPAGMNFMLRTFLLWDPKTGRVRYKSGRNQVAVRMVSSF